MNKFYLILFSFLLLVTVSVQAQVNRGFSFQGYARNNDGTALSGQSVTVKFTIYPTGSASSPDFTEETTLTTDAYGVFQWSVGTGSNSATFNKLNLSAKDYWLKVETKAFGSDYVTVSEAQLLAVPYAKSADNGIPAGTILPFGGNVTTVPVGYLVCDGSRKSSTDYPSLFAAIGTAWGNGTAGPGSSGNFNVPDLRGAFLRGVDGGRGWDPERTGRSATYAGGNSGDNVGSFEDQQYLAHNHSASTGGAGSHTHTYWDAVNDPSTDNAGVGGAHTGGTRTHNFASSSNTSNPGDHTHSVTINNNGGTETRPKNYNVYYIIKY